MSSGDHPVFAKPTDEYVKIWRYLNFAKFLAMLEDHALFFSRADKLGDPFEGSFPRRNVDKRPVRYPFGDFRISAESVSGVYLRIREGTFVNCWHMNPDESAAMWRVYARSEDAIAIQSTYSRLRDVLKDDVLMGQVKYIDYASDVIPEDNVFWPIVHKRRSFSHERELRAAICDLTVLCRSAHSPGEDEEVGKSVSVDLEKLIENIYVAPSAPPWFLELVKKVVTRYGLSSATVLQSSLDASPLF